MKYFKLFENFVNEGAEKLITNDMLRKIFPKLKFEFNPDDAHVDGDNIFVPFSSVGYSNSRYLASVRSTFEKSLKKALKAEGYAPKQYEVRINIDVPAHPDLSGWMMKIVLK